VQNQLKCRAKSIKLRCKINYIAQQNQLNCKSSELLLQPVCAASACHNRGFGREGRWAVSSKQTQGFVVGRSISSKRMRIIVEKHIVGNDSRLTFASEKKNKQNNTTKK